LLASRSTGNAASSALIARNSFDALARIDNVVNGFTSVNPAANTARNATSDVRRSSDMTANAICGTTSGSTSSSGF